MFSITEIKGSFIAIVLILSLSFPFILHSQDTSYIGDEASLAANDLLELAENTDFDNNISMEIFKDEKNSYYAIDISKLASIYEQIRILELSFANNTIVNIGSDKNTGFYFFLVNNKLSKSTTEINNLFNKFVNQSKTELAEMNDEQLRLWLIQHDKYSKKNNISQ